MWSLLDTTSRDLHYQYVYNFEHVNTEISYKISMYLYNLPALQISHA
jgi:hypothetical protein